MGEEENSRHMAGIILRVRVFDLGGNLRGLLQHSRDRTVFFFREANGILDGLVRNFPADAVNQLDVRIDGGRFGGALGLGADFEAGEGLALLLQDGDDIVAGAAAKPIRTNSIGLLPAALSPSTTIGVAAVGDTVETLLLDPGGAWLVI